MDAVDCVVVGAGVIGLAIARELALAGCEAVVLEQENAIGSHTSSRNSEVIHAGIYYPVGSLMARACVEGKRELYDYCRSHGVPHKPIGKLVVATSADEAGQLAMIADRARLNGVDDLQMIDGGAARRLEPALKAEAALLSPSTGIVDTHALMLAYLGDAEAAGAALALSTPFLGATVDPQGFVVRVGGAAPMELRCRILVNAAGLFAPDVAGRIDGLPAALVPTPYYARGVYFTLSGRSPFSRLIYPVPVPGGLGTHLTLDLGGQAKFGPDVEWIEKPDYSVDEGRRGLFAAAIRRYWPALDETRLVAGYAGVRPKLAPAGAPFQDFVVQGPTQHGVPGLVNLFGIESPGLTASLFLARHAVERLAD